MNLPDGDADYAHRWMLIKRRFTESLTGCGGHVVPRRGERGYALWQRRYWEHTIRDDRDYERHVDYIHFNPCKHGFVSRVRAWPYSSFHRYVRQGVLTEDWAGDASTMNSGKFGER
jgi:putative transposase